MGLAGLVHAAAASHAAVSLAEITSALERQQVPVPRQWVSSQGCSPRLHMGPGLTHCQVTLPCTARRCGWHAHNEGGA